ncbi:hypothetical protein [Gloeothece verrucosa]|uniref:Uncharacterized protein n=1 Tax=Gloeothece verrucosa (strain PCC 7822) TaxID=497965 RepID=E0UJR5_GLOV7|nr:hypothetical protein [Gloeothece verrucosa]ADN13426.1 conserved hypothetical protein [Gloeothece verrucosa PCC 7822]
MGKVANHLKSFWESCLLEHRHLNNTQRRGLVRWLLGESVDKLEDLTTEELASATRGIINRYRILQKHYLGVAPKEAYRHLFNRLGAVLSKYPLLRSWITASPEHQKTVVKTLQALIEQLLKVDPFLQTQQKQIALCTQDSSLRNALLLTTLEEYCLHFINDYPLLFHLLYHFLRHQSELQITSQQQKFLQLLSREIQQVPFNAQTMANFRSPLGQPIRQFAFEEAVKSYLETQLVS